MSGLMGVQTIYCLLRLSAVDSSRKRVNHFFSRFLLVLGAAYPGLCLAWLIYFSFMGLVVTKPVFRVSNKVRFNLFCSATQTS